VLVKNCFYDHGYDCDKKKTTVTQLPVSKEVVPFNGHFPDEPGLAGVY